RRRSFKGIDPDAHRRQSRCHASAPQDALEGVGRTHRYHRAERIAVEVRQSEGHSFRHARPNLCSAQLSARRYPGISPWERRRFTKHGTGLTALIFGNAFFAVVSFTNNFCAIQLFARGVTEGDCDADSRFSVLDRYWGRSQSAPSLKSWAACHMRSTSRL